MEKSDNNSTIKFEKDITDLARSCTAIDAVELVELFCEAISSRLYGISMGYDIGDDAKQEIDQLTNTVNHFSSMAVVILNLKKAFEGRELPSK